MGPLASVDISDTVPVPGNNDPSVFPLMDLPGGTGEEILLTCLFGALAMTGLAWAVSIAVRQRKFWPLAMFAGAAIASSAEPFIDILLHVVWPQTDLVFFTVYGREIPLYLTFGWILYFFPLGVWIILRIEQNAFATLRTWRWFIGICLGKTLMFEWLPVWRRWWIYYGDDQPLMIYRLPLHWIFINTCAISFAAVLVFVVKRFAFDDDERFTPLFVIIYPMGLIGSYLTMNAPVGTMLNATDNLAFTTAGALATIALCLFTLEMCGRIVVGTTQSGSLSFLRFKPERQPAAEVPEPLN